MMIFRFSNMATLRHLGFVACMFGSPTKGIWSSLSLYHFAKLLFCWNRRSSFDNKDVFLFSEFGLKMPVYAQKIGILGI